jgi:LysR family transcriptional regulator, low CO2-responsive transcriptional regulator
VCFRGWQSFRVRKAQIAELGKFCYLLAEQSFTYAERIMAGRFLREVTIRQLRALAAVHKHRSVTAAAKQLHLTQPAVTLQLRNLQDLAGLPLIQRTTDGMLLTDAGREVLALSERIEAAIGSCDIALDMIAGKTAGRISIGAVSTAKYFVPFVISGFSRLYPSVDVTLFIGNRQEIGTALRGYDLDIAIMGRPPVDIPMNVNLIGDHPHVIIAPTSHRLARKSRLALSDLANETFLTREPGSGTRGLMEQLFEQAKLRPKIGMAMSSNETIKQAVIAGLGIAFISAHTVATELDERRLVTLDVDGLPVVRQWFVLARKDKVLLPPAQAMLDFLSARGARFLPRTHGRLRLTRTSARGKRR